MARTTCSAGARSFPVRIRPPGLLTSSYFDGNIAVSNKTAKRTRKATIMAAVEDNWQTKRSTVVERTTFIFNNELLSDVKFVVPVSTGNDDSIKKTIPAHKFVLAISSPVLFAMFYGQMAETTDSIELPDCEYESLLELFRFLYSDEVNLSGRNVMQVLYLANKYMVPSLARKCSEYLGDNLKASNVFFLLSHAQKFEEKDLEERCWEVIEKQTEEAVTSDEFITLERSLVECVVKRERLNVKEVELFKAVDRWATKESERQGITLDGDVKRRILGEEIVKAIRFPLISQKEFISVAFDSHILTSQEAGNMIKYYDDVLTSPLPFTQTPRTVSIEWFCRCYRFAQVRFQNCSCCSRSYPGLKPDCVNFIVSKSIKLHGIQHFGRKGGAYTVSLEVKDASNDSSVVKQSGSYTSELIKIYDHCYYGFDVLFNHAVLLKKNKEYKVVSLIKGPSSWHGEEGKIYFDCEGVQFHFRRSPVTSNRTTQKRGQFPTFFFSLIE